MLDNIFSSSGNVWAGLIGGAIAIPVLIHLINLVRHKTVPWAAMKFLLDSHQRNRNHIRLKQALLLLARIATLLLALLLLGQVGCHQDRIARLLGGRSTHHYVILDDSFSMAHRGDNNRPNAPTAFDHAKRTLSLIAERAKDRQNQKFTLLRYSKIRTQSNAASITPADIDNILVDSQFDSLLETVKGTLEVSWLNIGIEAALTRTKTLIEQRTDENAIVYVLSDFRERDWRSSPTVTDDLAEVRRAGGAIELINCAEKSSANVAIVSLKPAGNVRVAGSPLMMELQVKNFGRQGVSKLQIFVSTTSYDQATTPEQLSQRQQDLPTVFIAEIAAGQTQTRLFPVFFDTPGKHVVTAAVDTESSGDGLTADDRRQCVVTFEPSAKVLIIDDAMQRHSNFISLALNPTPGKVGFTGIEPVFQTKAFLRDCDIEDLSAFDVTFLLDVDSLDDSAVRKLKTFCRSGGGVGFFAGPKSDLEFYNRLHEQGQGIYPIEFDQTVEVIEDVDSKTGNNDLQPANHPIFAPVNGQESTLLDLVSIEKVIAPTRSWLLKKPPTAEVIATIRGNAKRPLFVTGLFGQGRVIACTTTAGPMWNNWARNATFPPILLLMHDYLSAGRYSTIELDVQTPFLINEDSRSILPNAKLLRPVAKSQPRTIVELKLKPTGDGRLVNQISGQPGTQQDDEFEVQRPGIYEVWMQNIDGSPSVIRKGFNLDVTQSDLQPIKPAALATSLKLAQPTITDHSSFLPQPEIRPASSLTRVFLVLMILILVAEQTLAYLCSYHQS
jgi:hypothetical protein